MPTTLEEVRKQYPMYRDFSDQKLLDKLYSKDSEGLSKEDFANHFYGRGSFQKALTDIPKEIVKEYGGAVEDIQGYNKYREQHKDDKSGITLESILEGAKVRGKALGGALYAASPFPPVVGAAKSILGHAGEAVSESAQRNYPIKGAEPRSYEGAKSDVDALLTGAIPAAAGSKIGGRARPPPRPELTDKFGLTPPRGPVSTELSPGGQEHLADFKQQLHEQRQDSRGITATEMDPISQIGGQPQLLARTPREGGEAIQRGMQAAERLMDARVDSEYAKFRSMKGEFRSIGFQNFGTAIEGDITSLSHKEPALVDDVLTPASARMVKQLDGYVDELNARNSARIQGPGALSGFSLNDIHNMRKRLLQSANAAINETDERSAGMIIDSFDDKISAMVKNPGLYKGDPDAIAAWDIARNRSHEYKKAFKGTDDVGKIVQQIIRSNTIGNDVAVMALGGGKIIPKSVSVNVMKQVKAQIGEDSKEFIAAKQTLAMKVTGEPKIGQPEKTADRIREFVKSEMADVVWNSSDKRIMLELAKVHDTLGIKRIAPKESMITELKKKIGNLINLTVAGSIGHGGTHGLIRAGQVAAGYRFAKGYESVKEMRELEKALPLVKRELQKWDAAMAKSQRTNARVDRARGYAATYALSQLLRQKMGFDLGPMQPPNGGDKLDLKRYGGPQQ